MNLPRILPLLAAAALLIAPAYGQMAISAKAGLINVADGEVFVDGKAVEHNPNGFTTIPKDGTLKTAEGRAEVLLTPGSFLRVSEFSSFRLADNNTDNVAIDLLEGAALVEVTELLDQNQLTFRAQNQVIRPMKGGVYLIEISPVARVRAYDGGEVMVSVNDEQFVVKSNRELVASADGWVVNKFDSADTDPLYRWAKRRSEYISMANLSAARTAPGRNSMMGMGAGFGGMGMLGNWFYNPFFGTMTYVPWGQGVFSPFGYGYFNPYQAYRFYAAPQRYVVNRNAPFGRNAESSSSSGRWAGMGGSDSGFGGVRSGASSMGSVRSAPSGGFGGGGGAASAPSGGASAGGGARGASGGGARGGGRN